MIQKKIRYEKRYTYNRTYQNYNNVELEDNGELSYVSKRTVIDFGNINERLKSPWEIRKLGVSKMRSMGFTNMTNEDINPYRTKDKNARKKLIKLDGVLNEKSKAIGSPSTTNAEAIEMIEMTSKDIDTTIKDVEHDTSFFKPDDKYKLLPLRELEGLDKQLRTIKGSLKVAIAKRVDLKARIEHEE